MLWEPAIYEHKAKLIGKSVWEVANSATLLYEAVLAEHATYKADYLTVGLDVYNLEAEACGAVVAAEAPDSCPDIPTPPWALHDLPRELDLPALPESGRFPIVLDAAQRVRERLKADAVSLRVAASGPVSIAAKLVGAQDLLMALALGEREADVILEFASALCCRWCQYLRRNGLEVIIFDSSSTPPMIGPDMYSKRIQQFHAAALELLNNTGQTERPLIIGGDTYELLPGMLAAGATSVICDFAANASRFAERLEGHDVVVRRNVNPAVLSQATAAIRAAGAALQSDLSRFKKPVAGTGVLPYNTDPAKFWELRDAV